MSSNDNNSSGIVRLLCARSIGQPGTTVSSIGVLTIKLYNKAKESIETQGSHIKDFEDLEHARILGDNIHYVLSCHCYRLTRNKVPNGWCKPDDWNNIGSKKLAYSIVVKYFEPLVTMFQHFWHEHPNIQVGEEKCLQ